MTLSVILHLTHRDDTPIHYRFGAMIVSSPRLSKALDSFEVQAPSPLCGLPASGKKSWKHPTSTSIESCDRFWIASADRALHWAHHSNGISLRLPQFADCELEYATADLPATIRIHPQGTITSAELMTLILGPLLPMAMAAAGKPMLHAAMLESPEGLCLICGESGTGKSTLSARLSQSPGWRRLGDDIAWLEHADDAFRAENYPQLKLPESGKLDFQPEPNSITRFIVLERISAADPSHKPIETTALTGAQIVMSLLRHTVTARLYAPKQTATQLTCFAAWADTLSGQCHSLKIQSIEDSRLVQPIADTILSL